MPAPEPTRLDLPFIRARSEGRPVLVGYLPAGYPTARTSLPALRALARHVDVVELGLPCLDPMSSPLYRAAHRTALHDGATPAHALNLIRHLTTASPVPVLLNTAWSAVARHGARPFAAALASAGAAGVVLPDVHPNGSAAGQWRDAVEPHQLATAYVAAADQLAAAADASTGCVYLPARVTATRPIEVATLSRRRGQVRRYGGTDLPIVIGRGITSAQQAASLARYADGIAIGSALIHAAVTAPDPEAAVAHLAHCARRFALALRAAPTRRAAA